MKFDDVYIPERKNLKRRVGKISYTLDVLDENPEVLEELFSLLKFIPFRAETLYYNMTVEMQGISRHFREIDEGEEIPEYEIIVNDLNGYVTGISVKEIENV